MKKILYLLLTVILVSIQNTSFSQNIILYEFSDSICSIVQNNLTDSNSFYYLELSTIDQKTSSLSIERVQIKDTLQSIIYQKLVKYTNRYLLVKDKPIPIIFDTDYFFAFLGRTEDKRRGKYGRIKVLKFSEATVITFKNNGEIISIDK